MSHTPGPWRIGGSCRTPVNSKDKHIAMVNYSHRGHITDVIGEEHNANAHLIAAAPELLEALETLYGAIVMSDIYGESRITFEMGEAAEKAIAKAKGKLND